MASIFTSVAGALCLGAVLGACCSPARPCISGQVRPRPVYVDPEGFCLLERQIDWLNHRFSPYEAAMDRSAFPKGICKRLIQTNEDMQHVNAEMISREVAPEKIARQLTRIDAQLSRIESEICVPEIPEACCKSPRAMAASLDAQRAAQGGGIARTKPLALKWPTRGP